MRKKTTKQARGSDVHTEVREELAPEYRFDYKKSKPNRCARRIPRDVVVVLDSDVAEVFQDPKRVNELLRATIAAVEKKRKRRAG